MGLCGRRLGVLNPLFLCDECLTLGGMIVLRAPSSLSFKEAFKGTLEKVVTPWLEGPLLLEDLPCVIVFLTGGEMFPDPVSGNPALS